jgi:FkbM family methyltransferase
LRKVALRGASSESFSLTKAVARIIAAVLRAAAWLLGPRTRLRILAEASTKLAPIIVCDTQYGRLRFRCASTASVKAVMRFNKDEPETVHWINDIIERDECLWDIGANVGVYSLYAGLRFNGMNSVIAFEPGAHNFSALVDNIRLNRLENCVKPYCVALASSTKSGELHMRKVDVGEAGHGYGSPENTDGPFIPTYSQPTLAFSIDDLCQLLHLPLPDHIKIDVDGTEDRILSGARQTLRHVKTVLVESNELNRSAEWKQRLLDFLRESNFEEDMSFTRSYTQCRNRLFRNFRVSMLLLSVCLQDLVSDFGSLVLGI